MNKEQAKQSLKDGNKVTHKSFPEGEYLQLNGNGILIDEYGTEMDMEQFFKFCHEGNWDEGWEECNHLTSKK